MINQTFTDSIAAREYIKNFENLSPNFKGMDHVTTTSGRIVWFDKMTDEESIWIANELIGWEAEAYKNLTKQ